jgi:hypothetical protein
MGLTGRFSGFKFRAENAGKLFPSRRACPRVAALSIGRV